MTEQLSLNLFDEGDRDLHPAILNVVDKLATEGTSGTRGAIYTRKEVVNFILDLVEYSEQKPLYIKRILEPSFGSGSFLFPIVNRLINSWISANSEQNVVDVLSPCIRAVELHQDTFDQTRTKLIKCLAQILDRHSAIQLIDCWLIQGDFLLHPLEGQFDVVVGNPPYVRQENIPSILLTEYRRRYTTIYDRADLYIPFIERSLCYLPKGGTLGFICPDRWMKNRYGAPLRKLIADHYHLKIYVDMVNTAAFQAEVDAYPAITIIDRGHKSVEHEDVTSPSITRVVHHPTIKQSDLNSLVNILQQSFPLDPSLLKSSSCKPSPKVRELRNVVNGSEPWLLTPTAQMAMLRRIEQNFPLLEMAHCKVGIGVATGADKAFIGKFDELDVEPDRKLPLVTTKDIGSGEVQWQGQGIINPFMEHGLVNLDDYPRLKQYLEIRRDVIAKRHCAKKSPKNWYRTIDRIHPKLLQRPKLLIPDIKGDAHVVYEEGKLYPHHNLYYITSNDWHLRALQAVLLSSVTRLFISTYSPQMRGGFFRFQAQYLRRLHLPYWQDVDLCVREELISAAVARDIQACNEAVFKLYFLTTKEIEALNNVGG